MTHEMTDLRLRRIHQRLEALEAALAQQAEPVQEPVPWRCACGANLYIGADGAPRSKAEPVQEPVPWTGYDLDGMVEAFSRVIEAHHSSKHPFHNPIDMDAQMALRILRGFIPTMKAYAAPPQRKPLTEEEVEQCFRAAGITIKGHRWTDAARNVERAHGIKERV